MGTTPPKQAENPSMLQCLKSCTNFIFAWSLDSMGHSSKDGYSAFNALAGFAVAQAVALTAVAKGEGRTMLVLSIYFVATCLTILWTARLLRATRQEANGQGAAETVRAFDLPSIQHGRFTLTWILVVAVVLIVLAWLGLLPNQTSREYYAGGIKLAPSYFESRVQDHLAGVEGSKDDRQEMDIWLSWIQPQIGKDKLVWLEQTNPFPAHQKSMNVQLTYDADLISVSRRVAFLVKPDGASDRPNLREMKFDLAPPTFDQSDRLTLVEPDPDEALLIMCFVEARPGKTLTSVNDCNFSITRR